jgi:hypothetical protein
MMSSSSARRGTASCISLGAATSATYMSWGGFRHARRLAATYDSKCSGAALRGWRMSDSLRSLRTLSRLIAGSRWRYVVE